MSRFSEPQDERFRALNSSLAFDRRLWPYDIAQSRAHARMLAHLADSSYNYNALGPAGFNALARLADGSTCHKLTYSSLDEALALFDELATAPHEAPGT